MLLPKFEEAWNLFGKITRESSLELIEEALFLEYEFEILELFIPPNGVVLEDNTIEDIMDKYGKIPVGVFTKSINTARRYGLKVFVDAETVFLFL